MIRILGIDPALTCIGWGVIDINGSSINYLSSGTINTKSSDIMPFRLSFISQQIENLILEFKPQIAAMEEVFINMNAVSSMKLCHARGAIMSVIGKYNIPLSEFAPNKIKKTLVGAGKADKNQILYMINMIMPNAGITQLDEADALAAAYCCSVHNQN